MEAVMTSQDPQYIDHMEHDAQLSQFAEDARDPDVDTCDVVLDTLRHCYGHADTDAEAEIVMWVAQQIATNLTAHDPGFDSQSFMALVSPLEGQAKGTETRKGLERYVPLT
jgi:hypothetical protein